MFAGAVVILAGGPSLKGFDFERLRGKDVIAINRAYEVAPFARMLWWSDAKFWRKHKEGLLAHAAELKATLHLLYETDELPPEVTVYHASGLCGFDDRPGFLRHGNNSTYAAMHAAVHLGARKLILLGVDMGLGPNGESHFHGGYDRPSQPHTYKDLMLPQFKHLVEPLQQRGVEVVNANPASNLTLWPRVRPEDAL